MYNQEIIWVLTTFVSNNSKLNGFFPTSSSSSDKYYNNINIKYELENVKQALNNLSESIYNLNQPFEDELKSIENRIDEINLDNEYKEVI